MMQEYDAMTVDFTNSVHVKNKQNHLQKYLIEGFTPEQQAEFDKGNSVEKVFNQIGKKYGLKSIN